jgi:hypothetical protein
MGGRGVVAWAGGAGRAQGEREREVVAGPGGTRRAQGKRVGVVAGPGSFVV